MKEKKNKWLIRVFLSRFGSFRGYAEKKGGGSGYQGAFVCLVFWAQIFHHAKYI